MKKKKKKTIWGLVEYCIVKQVDMLDMRFKIKANIKN